MASKTVAIVGKSKPELAELVPGLVQRLLERGYSVIVDPDAGQCVAGGKCITAERSAIATHKPEFVIVLGGDGTLLAAARAVATAKIPLLAVNLGSLGFLTEVRREEMFAALDAVEQNRCIRDVRSMLACKLQRRDTTVGEFVALNDVVITMGSSRVDLQACKLEYSIVSPK